MKYCIISFATCNTHQHSTQHTTSMRFNFIFTGNHRQPFTQIKTDVPSRAAARRNSIKTRLAPPLYVPASFLLLCETHVWSFGAPTSLLKCNIKASEDPGNKRVQKRGIGNILRSPRNRGGKQFSFRGRFTRLSLKHSLTPVALSAHRDSAYIESELEQDQQTQAEGN